MLPACVDNCLPTFRDGISVPSSRDSQSKKNDEFGGKTFTQCLGSLYIEVINIKCFSTPFIMWHILGRICVCYHPSPKLHLVLEPIVGKGFHVIVWKKWYCRAHCVLMSRECWFQNHSLLDSLSSSIFGKVHVDFLKQILFDPTTRIPFDQKLWENAGFELH